MGCRVTEYACMWSESTSSWYICDLLYYRRHIMDVGNILARQYGLPKMKSRDTVISVRSGTMCLASLGKYALKKRFWSRQLQA